VPNLKRYYDICGTETKIYEKKIQKKRTRIAINWKWTIFSLFLSDIHKVWKFYWILVWNVETRHLMHKVEDYITQVGVMKIYVETMEAFTKKKHDQTEFTTKIVLETC